MTWYDPTPPVEQLPDERWLPTPMFERFYSVSDQGRIYSFITEQLIAAPQNNQGVAQVYLRGHKHTLASLVLTAFGRGRPGRSTVSGSKKPVPGSSTGNGQPKPSAGSWYIRYADGDRSNCALSNLEWRPRAELPRGHNKPRTHCRKGHPLIPGESECVACLPEVVVADEV